MKNSPLFIITKICAFIVYVIFLFAFFITFFRVSSIIFVIVKQLELKTYLISHLIYSIYGDVEIN